MRTRSGCGSIDTVAREVGVLVGAPPRTGSAAQPGPAADILARVLRSDTRAGIYRSLREGGEERTVRDVAAHFDLHPNVARTHLELLAQAGLVTVGRRKHPGGGRPAKVYRAEADAPDPVLPPASRGVDAALVVRLLAGLVGVVAPARPVLLARAFDAAAAEGRRLVAGALRYHQPAADLRAAAEAVMGVLTDFAPDARVVRGEPGGGEVLVAGVRPLFATLVSVRPDLADALERGLLIGALTAAGAEVALIAGAADDGGPAWRLRVASASGARHAPVPAATVDTRGLPREAAVVAALRAATRLQRGQVLEVLTEGPGAPAAFARWADRAGHSLLGVERVEPEGRAVIRLLVRKGS